VNSPTITSPAMTLRGMILGTAAYMSPEQAKGKPVDKRTDIWAFGCVLYEMLAGRRAFEGEDVSDTLAAILRGQPDWTMLPALPTSVDTLIRRCLERDWRRRIGSMSTVRFVLEEPAVLSPPRWWMPRRRRRGWRRPWRWRVATSWCVVSSLWRVSPPSPLRRPAWGSLVTSRRRHRRRRSRGSCSGCLRAG
jgi:serine/threonine protein kinase